MSDVPLLDGDLILFDPLFGTRTVTPLAPAMMRASGHATCEGRRLCVLGDEAEIQVPAQYSLPGYTPGSGAGIITIAALAGDQQASSCRDGAPILLRGSEFTARFTPSVPATNLQGGVDVTVPSMGTGRFQTVDFLVQVG